MTIVPPLRAFPLLVSSSSSSSSSLAFSFSFSFSSYSFSFFLIPLIFRPQIVKLPSQPFFPVFLYPGPLDVFWIHTSQVNKPRLSIQRLTKAGEIRIFPAILPVTFRDFPQSSLPE
jgi:hypothetical protein